MKNRTIAGLLGIFLGAFGVHHFYLGNHKKGILYAVMCWTMLPRLASFIEAISYFRMSDEAFNRKYNTNYLASKPISNTTNGLGVADEVLKLSQLLDRNVITFEEFERRKIQLLKSRF
jgi:TM2 domain-containing membrane protein YozV